MKIRARPAFFAAAAFLLALNPPHTLALFAVPALFHEAGHLLAARLQKRRLEGVEFGAGGVCFSFSSPLQSYASDAVLALAGPFFNFALCAALIPVLRARPSEPLFFLFFAGLHLALFNLLPAPSLDGGKALYALLCRRLSPERAESVLRAAGRLSAALLFALGALFLAKRGDPFLLFAAALLAFGG